MTPRRTLQIAGIGASLLAALFAPAKLSAQAPGSVTGTVTSEAKTPVANARVSIETPSRATATNDKGVYTLRDVPPGSYEVIVSAVGYAPKRQAITVSSGQASQLDLSLSKGSLMLSGVVVSATRTPEEASKVAATVNLLTPHQIQTSPARETQDMLREIPGIELPRTSSQVGGTAQIVSIRGVDEGRTAVLLDGVPINDAWGEWIDWSRVPKGSIERVEVLEGGGSSIWGNGAMGGVISMYSRPVTPFSYRLTMDGGSRDAKHTYASVGVPLYGPFALALTGDYGDGGGYKLITGAGSGPVDTVVESASIRRNATARLEYAPSSKLSGFITGHSFSDNRGLGTPLSRTTRKDGAVDFGINYGSEAKGAFFVRGWNREMEEDQTATTLSTVAGVPRSLERRTAFSQIPSTDRGAGVTWSRAALFGFEQVNVGGDYRYMDGSLTEQDFANNAGNAPTTKSSYGGNQALSGVFVSGLLAPMNKMRVELSLRTDWWGNNDGFADTLKYADATASALSPRVGVKYQFMQTLSMHSAVYRAFRAPNLAELYRKSTTATTITLPNAALKPEYALGYEVGLDWQPISWAQLKGTLYQANYSDFNTFVTTSAVGVTPSTRMRLNVQKSKSLGGEVYVAVRPIDHFLFSTSFNYNDDRVSDLGPVAPTATVFKGARIGRVPAQKATVRAEYESAMLGTWVAMGRYEGSNTTLGNAATLPPFRVYDLSAMRPIMKGISVFASVENVFDGKYQVNRSGTAALPIITLGLPRTFRLGIDAIRY